MKAQRRGKYYYVEDLPRLVSVTTILDVINKPQLITWAARQAAEASIREPGLSVERIVSKAFEKRNSAADRGTSVHKLIDALNRGETLKEQNGYIDAFHAFCGKLNPKTLLSEQLCYSIKHLYAGTTDWIIQLPNSEVWLVDFKTGGIYREAGLQVCAYKEAINEMIDKQILQIPKVQKTLVVRFYPNGTYEERLFDEPFEIFLNAKRLWEWCNNLA